MLHFSFIQKSGKNSVCDFSEIAYLNLTISEYTHHMVKAPPVY